MEKSEEIFMKRIAFPFVVSGIILILLFVGFVIWGVPYFFQPAPVQAGTTTLGSQTELARVTKIIDEGQIVLNSKSQLYQVMQAEVLQDDFKGITFQVEYGNFASCRLKVRA
jgi:hypothetical protein